MKLIGNFLSPFARRVAVSLNAMGFDYEMNNLLAFGNEDAIRPHNPLVRVPTLILDNNEVLVESYAILDYLDEVAGDHNRLIPARGAERRRVMKDTAVGVGSMDRAQWAVYEFRHRPEEKVHQPWADHNDVKALAGLKYLDVLAEKAGDANWLSGTDRMSQSDISAAVSYGFAAKVRPNLNLAGEAPALTSFVNRCEVLEAFASSPIPD